MRPMAPMTNQWTAERVRELRTRLGLNQTEFAAEVRRLFPAIRTHQVSVSRWEGGRVTPGGAAAYALDLLAADSQEDETP